MKLYTLLLSLALLTTAATQAQKNAEKIIRSVLQTQTAAWNRGDLDNFMVGYWESDSLLFVGKNGATYGYQATLANYRKSYPTKDEMGTLKFDIKHVRNMGKGTYFVLGAWFLERKVGNVQGMYTLIWRKINGQWKIVVDHSS
ncbi:MAG: nuclear transport factor 2 family protein [Bacteroidetes bacterium]|nr:MAG: nuclear transport factor 2 family protein [Bacteroidota bacterium]TAF98497.1 MAG: nuclear transport factor 2 family protein [Bacteroidota bacterium]